MRRGRLGDDRPSRNDFRTAYALPRTTISFVLKGSLVLFPSVTEGVVDTLSLSRSLEPLLLNPTRQSIQLHIPCPLNPPPYPLYPYGIISLQSPPLLRMRFSIYPASPPGLPKPPPACMSCWRLWGFRGRLGRRPFRRGPIPFIVMLL